MPPDQKVKGCDVRRRVFLLSCVALYGAVLLTAGGAFASLPVSQTAGEPSGIDRARHNAPAATGTPTGTPPVTVTPTSCYPSWSMVPSPNVGTNSNTLNDVSAVSTTDVWAVGEYRDASTGVLRMLIMHWDGIEWNIVPGPNVGTDDNTLNDVSAVSASDVWVVGEYWDPGQIAQRTLIAHWDGTAWAVVPSPNMGTINTLKGVSAVSASDVWAVGYYLEEGTQKTLVLHWDGISWAVVPSPNHGTNRSMLLDVSAVSGSDVWAVGYYRIDSSSRTLVLHWDGMSWSVVPHLDLLAESQLQGVSAVSANDVWAVGYARFDLAGQSLVLHWDGTQWTVMSPSPGMGSCFTTAVTAVSANDVWVVGECQIGSPPAYAALMAHWNGNQWSAWHHSVRDNTDHFLNGVARALTNDVWAVGYYIEGAGLTRTLVERYSCPTPCTAGFADVPWDSTFYPFVHCLACRYILSGYPCGGLGEPCNWSNRPYFRPNNHITRGQLAKIVSESAGFSEVVPPSQWTFTDVPYGSTFWEWVERLSNHEVLSGYPCGVDPNEPCDDHNRPYFRPNAGATRGQLTKIVSNAAGFDDTIPNTQYTFTDVMPGSTFWLYIERLLSNRPGAIQGYPCGGSGEPCDSESRPYFRPNNGVTRGQAAKIVANTFFPGCNPVEVP